MTNPSDHELIAVLARVAGVRGKNKTPNQHIIAEMWSITRFCEYFNDRTNNPINAGDCIIWVGPRNNLGYGIAYFMNWKFYAHRAAYIRKFGSIQDGLELDHLCRNRGCVNPDHLDAVSHKENIARGESPSAKCAKKEYCVRGHKLDPQNLIRNGNGPCLRNCRECNKIRGKAKYAKKRAFALAVYAMDQSQKGMT